MSAVARSVPVLAVEGLVVRYREREVLKGLDLEIEAGGIHGLLGPNGAGKTTLIRTICGRVRPVSGRIGVVGEPGGSRAALRQIGLVPQEVALYTHLTVRENLETFARLSGLSAGETRRAVAWAEEAARLGERHSERIDILSGGWKRRVNIAAAVLHRPKLLILDEPTVGVDVDARNELHEVIRDLSDTGMGVLLATHDLDQAETLCSSVGFLRDGVIAPQGPPAQLIHERFGGHSEVIVEVRAGLDEKQTAMLQSGGFVPSKGGQSWSVLGEVGDAGPALLTQRLEEAGVKVREVRLRKPGLDTLFVHLARGEEGGK